MAVSKFVHTPTGAERPRGPSFKRGRPLRTQARRAIMRRLAVLAGCAALTACVFDRGGPVWRAEGHGADGGLVLADGDGLDPESDAAGPLSGADGAPRDPGAPDAGKKNTISRMEGDPNGGKECRYYSAYLLDNGLEVRRWARENVPSAEELIEHSLSIGVCPYEVTKSLIQDAVVVTAPYGLSGGLSLAWFCAVGASAGLVSRHYRYPDRALSRRLVFHGA